MTSPSVEGELSLEGLVGRAADEFTEALQRGERPDVEEFAQRYPEIATLLRQALPALRSLGTEGPEPPLRSETDPTPTDTAGQLGDYRLLREVGRGGMGIVYEAEQISLGRRVALKVLPFAATMDPRHLQRFQNEARAAASLDHPRIVKVYGVGVERGVHYFAMQFIDGQTIEALIRERRATRPEGNERPTPSLDVRATATAENGATGPSNGVSPAPLSAAPTAEQRARLSTLASLAPNEYLLRVAEWGIQAAEALEHAHGLGIVHRDIKPANLMLDAHGKLWVTDFGLARTAADSGLTMTGDLLGTLRYMSPEQALAKHGLVDHRTDVYALGATLYELLTLRPVVKGNDRAEILNAIASQEIPALRSLDAAVPVDLETVVLKAVAKEAHERYPAAKDLADDLRRWLEHRPVLAKRLSLAARARKWARRNRTLVWSLTAAALIMLAALGAVSGWLARDAAARRGEIEIALSEADDLQQQKRLPEALAAARRAETLLLGDESEAGRRVRQRSADLRMALKLEDVRLERSLAREGDFDTRRAERAYARAFSEYGIPAERLTPEEIGERIRESSIAVELASALDEWAWMREPHKQANPTAAQLVAAARIADPDPWRCRLRDAAERQDRDALRQLAASAAREALSATSLDALARALHLAGEPRLALEVLRGAQQQHPADFWINETLASTLASGPNPPQEWLDAAIGYHRAAVALRPHSPGAHFNLGNALSRRQRKDEAIAAYRASIRLQPDNYEAHFNLASTLTEKGDLDGCIKAYRDAISVKSDESGAHYNLGNALMRLQRREEAIRAYRSATEIDPQFADAHYDLGIALAQLQRWDEAITALSAAKQLKPDDADAHQNLATVLGIRERYREAAASYREAARGRPAWPVPHRELAWLLANAPDVSERDPGAAVAAARRAVELAPKSGLCRMTLGAALYRNAEYPEAVMALVEASGLKRVDDREYFLLAMSHWMLGRLAEGRLWYARGVGGDQQPAE